MSKKAKGWEHSYRLDGARAAFSAGRHDGQWSGGVACPEGMVQVDRGPTYTTYETVIDGRKHFRYEETPRTATGAAIVARRWLRGLLGL